MLGRTADEESWVARLWRHRWWAKGRPDPGNADESVEKRR
jgi:hypothetical protein